MSAHHSQKKQYRNPHMKIKTLTRRFRQFSWLAALLLGLLTIQITGCSSVPEGSAAIKQQALSFAPPPGMAAVYVIRPFHMLGGAVLTSVSLDYQEFGLLHTSSYLYGTVPPGQHTVRANDKQFGFEIVPFTAEAGKNYYFKYTLELKHPVIEPIPEPDGQAYVRKFKLSGDNRFELRNLPGQTQQ
jgi:hypothetical protein